MERVPEGLLDELRGRLGELVAETVDGSDGREVVTVAVEGLTLALSALEVDAVHLAVLDPELEATDPVSALVAAAAGLRLATELDLVRQRGGDASAVAALARSVQIGRRLNDALKRVARDFVETGAEEAGAQVAGAAASLADSLARAGGVGARDAVEDDAGEDVAAAPRRGWWPFSRR